MHKSRNKFIDILQKEASPKANGIFMLPIQKCSNNPVNNAKAIKDTKFGNA